MCKLTKIIAGIAVGVTLSVATISGWAAAASTPGDYSLINAAQYVQTVQFSRQKAQQLVRQLQVYPSINDAKLRFITRQLTDLPYLFTGAMGEGDWGPQASTYEPGAVHIMQNPVYRLDGFDCQTFVQTVMALVHAKNFAQFEKNILLTAYGAAGNPAGEYVHYFNRNNFTDGDWNPVNRKSGWLQDVTATGELATVSKESSATLTRQNWFDFKEQDLPATVTVLADSNGPPMVQRFTTLYANLPYPHFASEEITIAYIPKEKIALLQSDGSYIPNKDLLAKIPTPAVVEIIRDPKRWQINGKNIKDAIGTELTVSHLGLVHRERFQQGELIYRQISCHLNTAQEKVCDVKPVTCQHAHCAELMFTHATDSHPDGYYWYAQTDGHYSCSATLPAKNVKYTLCNRVESLPLFAYLTDYQYGSYRYMATPSLLGIHIEVIL
jgi:hypothetical protein